MSPRRLASVAATLAFVLFAAWLLFFDKTDTAPAPAAQPAATPAVLASVPPPVPPTVPSSTSSSATPRAASGFSSTSPAASTVGAPSPTAGVPPASPGTSPDVATVTALEQTRLMLRDYRTLMGENPVGTNAEIMRALMGGNPRQAKLAPESQTLNDQGELVDRWGTPFFFHQLSKNVMEIRSAGPDKVMWTEDDIVAK